MGGFSMPRGPKGEYRPSDTIECAVMVGRIATGEIRDTLPSAKRRSGLAGAKARNEKLSPERRSEIARKARAARD